MVKRITGTAALVCGLVVGIAGPAAAAQTATIGQCVGGGGTAVINADSSACVGGAFDGYAIRW